VCLALGGPSILNPRLQPGQIEVFQAVSNDPDDVCPQPRRLTPQSTEPHTPPIYLSSVYECRDPDQADALLSGRDSGYVYRRDGQPNADLLAEACSQLHATERAAITSSGMAALALAVLARLQPGDHTIVSNQLYGRTQSLLVDEAGRWGIASTLVDACDLHAVDRAITSRTRLLVVETISNPLLRVADLAALASLAHSHQAELLVDNTLAGPVVCRPASLGADWVMESITKTMNGHSDVILGVLCGSAERWQRVPGVLSTWGLASAAFDSWLALRGLGTLSVRIERACANAMAAARRLSESQAVEAVHYPGLPAHPDHELARRQFGERFGSLVTFTLRGGRAAATAFMAAAKRIPFCPSLGELSTTLSHPESTSHRALSPEARGALGITGGTIRLSVGIESAPYVVDAISEGLTGLP
jgi:cystathionine beta-lyase/cystathionine gamma-synthase